MNASFPIFFYALRQVICLAFLGIGLQAMGQFIDVSGALGDPIVNSGSPHGDGISFYDFNYDGWDDLTISNGYADPRFYVNNNGTLEPASFTIENTPTENISMMLWSDYDNDGDADLLITKFGAPVQLWQNQGDFNFTEVAAQAGIWPGSYDHVGAAFADYNHDGCLDLYIAKFYHPNFSFGNEYTGRLYLNNCDGTFTDATDSSGVHIPPRPCFQPVFLDYNNDGWEDLLLVIDRTAFTNELFHNNGDGTFTNVTMTSGFDFPFDAMTGTVGDFDNDADLDVFMTNNPYYPFGTVLMENNGDGTFDNTAALHGVNLFQVTWGGMWLDYDNDSWQDLFVSVTSPVLQPIGNQFYVNNEGEGFTVQNEMLGIADDNSESYVCAQGDLNNDGYFDFALNNETGFPAKLYLNDGGNNNYLSVSVEGTIANRDGIGTWLHCYADGQEFVRYTLSGENLIGQNSGKEIFGLGDITVVDSLVIQWNSGTHEVMYNPAVNTHHHCVEGATFSLPFAVEVMGSGYLCPGDSVLLNAGTFDTYLWNTGWDGQYLTVHEPGEYSVTVTNGFGLEVQSVPITISNAPETELSFAVDHISCNGFSDGSILVNADSGPLSDVIWSSGDTSPFVDELPPGNYFLSATDEYGCAVNDSVFILEPEPLITVPDMVDVACYGEASGSASAVSTGGTPPYFYNWFGENPNVLSAGEYEVQTTDWQACTHVANFVIDEPDSIHIEVLTTDAVIGGTPGTASLNVSGGVPPYTISWSTGDMNTINLVDLDAGEYTVTVTDFNNCVKSDSFSIAILTALNDLESQDLNIYPNPFVDVLNIANCNTSNLEIVLTDLTGRQIKQFNTYDCPVSIEMGNLPTGMYLLQTNRAASPTMVIKR